MNLYTKINNYLLLHLPNIWITRVHFFLPIAIFVIALFFSLNAFVVGYNIENDLPDSAWAIVLSIIPVLIFIVFWFVIQARYNVEKSGGTLSLLKEYLNFGLYFLIFTFSLGIIFVFPLSNDYKISHSVSSDELSQDIRNLDLGNSVVNYRGTITRDNNTYTFQPVTYVSKVSGDDNYDREIFNKEITVNKRALNVIVNDYITSYNKYTTDKIEVSPEMIIKDNLSSNYNSMNDDVYYDSYSPVPYKLYRIKRIQVKGWYDWLLLDEGFYFIMVFMTMLALLVWIFKQIHWKYFVFGIIALLLTPLFVTIFALIFFELLNFSDDQFAPIFIVFIYVICGFIVAVGVGSKSVNHTSVVVAFYLQFFIPFFPLFVRMMFDDRMKDEDFELIFWFGLFCALLSIGVFKYIYQRMRLLPLGK